MHPLVDVRLSSFPLETFWIILFVVFMETYSTLLSLQQIQRNRTHTQTHSPLEPPGLEKLFVFFYHLIAFEAAALAQLLQNLHQANLTAKTRDRPSSSKTPTLMDG